MASTTSAFRYISMALVLAATSSVCAGNEAPGGLFQWMFGNNFTGTSLPTCQSIPIDLIPKGNNTSTAPYAMVAFPLGGTPRIYPLGSGNNSLSFTLDYAPDTKFMLYVVDASGSSGGVPPSLYTAVAGSNTSCVKKDDASSNFTISANLTNSNDTQLGPCDAWGVTVKGGVPPYTFLLPELNAVVVPNITTPTKDQNALLYVNRVPTNTTLLAAAIDSSGKFAYGSPYVNTTGTNNATCPY